MASPSTTSQAELKAHRIPLGWRDRCSVLLIPLDVCRRKHWYLPWECDDERHAYERCQYLDFVRRMKLLSEQKVEEN